MATSTERQTLRGYGPAVDVVAGSVSGLVAAVFGSIVLQLAGSLSVVTTAIPTVAGLDTPAPVAGWLLFALVGIVLGAVYAAAAGAVGIDFEPTRGALAGAGYGLVLWLVVAVVAVPLTMPPLGYAAAPAFPYVDPVAFVGYVGFGVVLGYFHATLAPVAADPTGDAGAWGA